MDVNAVAQAQLLAGLYGRLQFSAFSKAALGEWIRGEHAVVAGMKAALAKVRRVTIDRRADLPAGDSTAEIAPVCGVAPHGFFIHCTGGVSNRAVAGRRFFGARCTDAERRRHSNPQAHFFLITERSRCIRREMDVPKDEIAGSIWNDRIARGFTANDMRGVAWIKVIVSGGERSRASVDFWRVDKLRVLDLSFIAPEVQPVDVAEREPDAWVERIVVREIMTRNGWVVARYLNTIERADMREVRPQGGFILIAIHCDGHAIDHDGNASVALDEVYLRIRLSCCDGASACHEHRHDNDEETNRVCTHGNKPKSCDSQKWC